ncbi:DUF4012 domain-containing protein [Oerskovia flava]|uniref:DUF4012 domain-containing protein n=1 Tax=Oerskovia flava TaxID=2986422 RepID=UPI00223F4477|nr:DUF4012 domain-containing protein [Oerskovia sp. JB1-3-2]
MEPPREEGPTPRVRAVRGRRRPRRRRTVLIVVAAVLVVAIAVMAWVAVDALRARTALTQAAQTVAELQQVVVDGDTARAEALVADLQRTSARSVELTTGPHWRVASTLPWVGPNTDAVTTLADVVDDLAQDALPQLTEAARVAAPGAMTPVDGRVDLAPIEAVRADVVRADAAVGNAVERVRALEGAGLVDVLDEAASTLTAELVEVHATTATAARAVQLVPPMLGTDGPRDYLLLVQNNAEPRATGGIPGSVVHLRADDGEVTFVGQESGSDLGALDEPALALSGAEQALFGPDLGRYMLNVNFTPDFPRSAELARAIWAERFGEDVDGVLSMDPVALSLVLGASGAVEVDDPTGVTAALTAENAVDLLLNRVYLDIEDTGAQDEFFGAAAGAVFDSAISGEGDAAAVVTSLAEAARQGRFLVWSAHEQEQSLLGGTVLSGDLVGERSGSPVVGVYLNASSAAKMGYYLDTSFDVTRITCRPDGSQSLTLAVTLTSTLDEGGAGGLPAYVTSSADRSGTIHTNLLVYAPRGGGILESSGSDGVDQLFSQSHEGLVVGGRTVAVPPGGEQTYTYAIVTGKNQRGPLELRTTPGARESRTVSGGRECG